MRSTLVVGLALAFLSMAVSALAQEDFYGSTDIEMVVPASAGGAYGTYAQLVSDHLGRHIAGEPGITLNFMSGAGGLRASNHVANVSANDGSVIYMMHQNAPISQLLLSDSVKYDAAQFIPIGTISSTNAVMIVSDDLGVETVADLVGMPVNAGSTGRGSYTFVIPATLNEMIGTEFNIVTTYGGSSEVLLAMERKEIQMFMTSTVSLKRGREDWASGEGGASVMLQVGTIRDPDFADVPLLTEMSATPDQMAVFNSISSSHAIARSLVAVPGTPEARVAQLREAFNAMVSDPEFISDAERLGLPLRSGDADFLGETIRGIVETPEAVIEMARRITAE